MKWGELNAGEPEREGLRLISQASEEECIGEASTVYGPEGVLEWETREGKRRSSKTDVCQTLSGVRRESRGYKKNVGVWGGEKEIEALKKTAVGKSA